MKSPHTPKTTEGPLGFPMTDKQARSLDMLLKQLPKEKEYGYRKTIFHKAATELNPGARSDVSWISTEAVDRYGHVVVASGMDDSQFALNPIVTLNHQYDIPPIGRSLWRQVVAEGFTSGVKAKTVYPPKPASWGADSWPPDKVFTLIQAGLLNGKSIGWLPTKLHYASAAEAEQNAWPDGTLVIEEWLLIEYAVATIPVNPETVVEIVAKASPLPAELCKALGWDEAIFRRAATGAGTSFTPLAEIENAAARAVHALDLPRLVQDAFDRKRGRV